MADSPVPDSSDDTPKGFTLDLSTGKAPSRRKRKRNGPAPVVQQTINLSTPKPDKPAKPDTGGNELATTPKASGAPQHSRKPHSKKPSGGGRRERPTPRSGNSLADLLDPETLARLRGE